MDCIIFNVGENEKRFLEELAKRYNTTTDDVIREAIQEYWSDDYYDFFKVADTPQTDCEETE